MGFFVNLSAMKVSMIFWLQGMNRIFKCFNSLLITLHSFHPCCIFWGKFAKSRIMNSFKKKKIFHSCRYQNPNRTLVALMLFMPHSCLTRVALVLLVSHSHHTCVARPALASLVSSTRDCDD